MAKVFSCAVIGDVLAEPDTVIKSIVTKKAVASRTSFTGTQEELEAAKVSVRKEVQSMSATGSFPTVTTAIVAAGGAEVTVQFTPVLDPDTLLNLSPPPNLVMLCYTPVAHTTLKTLEMVWVPTLTQMFARPQVVLVATRVETLAHQKIMDRVGTKPVTCETIIDKASSWRAVDYVEVSAACNIHMNTLLNALGMAGLHIPAQRMTSELAKEQRKDCMKPILSTQSVWTYKRHPGTGRVFYGNRITEQSQWTRPDDYDGEEPELTEAEKEAEGMAKRQLEEKRIREQHERQLDEQVRQEVAVHNERVRELEKRSTILTRDVAELQIRVGDIRDVIQRNRREREELERQQDQLTEARFAKSTIDDDLRIERDINDAKIKLFMLEGRVALADDLGSQTTEIAEAILVNNSFATQLRELIAEQLKVRRHGSTSQSEIDTLSRLQSDATTQVANLVNRGPALRDSLLSAEAELAAAKKARQACIETRAQLSAKLHASDKGPSDRHHHVSRLQKEIKALDAQILTIRAEKGLAVNGTGAAFDDGVSALKANAGHPLQAEGARAGLEQRALVTQLATGACECAQFEIACRQKLELLKYVVSEYKFAANKRVEAVEGLCDATSQLRDLKLLGPSYPISNPHELRQLQLAVDDRILELGMMRHRHTSTSHSSNAPPGAKKVEGRYTISSSVGTRGQTPTRAKTPTGNAYSTTSGKSVTGKSPAANTPRRGTKLSDTNPSLTGDQPSYLVNQQTATLNRYASINELKQVKLLLSSEQESEQAVEVLAVAARGATQRLRSAKSKTAQQSADLKDALVESLKEITGLERMKGYESASPLERLVSLVDGAITAAAAAAASSSPSNGPAQINASMFNNSEASLVTDVANQFTEKMLQSVPISERAAVAHELNHTASRDLNHKGPVPSGQAIAEAISGAVSRPAQSHHAAVNDAAMRGILAATASATEESTLLGTRTASLNEKVKRLEAQRSDSTARYTRHAERIKSQLGVMQGPTAVQKDDTIRVQHRFYKR